MSVALKGRMKRGTALYEMAGLYVPQELIWEGVAPLKKSGMTQYGKWPKWEKM